MMLTIASVLIIIFGAFVGYCWFTGWYLPRREKKREMIRKAFWEVYVYRPKREKRNRRG
jgi:hypothetical protein